MFVSHFSDIPCVYVYVAEYREQSLAQGWGKALLHYLFTMNSSPWKSVLKIHTFS